MKRLQFMIEEELDSELGRVARSEGRSKAAVIRGLVRAHIAPPPPLEDDPVTKLAGVAAFEPEHHDDVAYG